jgi:hypothetical protein
MLFMNKIFPEKTCKNIFFLRSHWKFPAQLIFFPAQLIFYRAATQTKLTLIVFRLVLSCRVGNGQMPCQTETQKTFFIARAWKTHFFHLILHFQYKYFCLKIQADISLTHLKFKLMKRTRLTKHIRL